MKRVSWLALVAVACAPATTSTKETSERPPRLKKPTGQRSLHGQTGVEAAGFHVATPSSLERRFICSSTSITENCVCWQPLPCAGTGDCMSLSTRLAVFRDELASTGEETVGCDRAEVGRCGGFSYFYFRGDIFRDEMRWYDATGEPVAVRNTTDNDQYCGGATYSAWWGAVPDCEVMVRDELICGEAQRPLKPPIGDLRALSREI